MPATLRLSNISDVQLEQLSRDNPGWQLERSERGTLLVSPTSSEDGARSAEALVQLALWSPGGPGGKVFDSSTGFTLRDNSVLSPDAAWISPEHLAKLPAAARRKFWAVSPDVVVELRSQTDSWPEVQQKNQALRRQWNRIRNRDRSLSSRHVCDRHPAAWPLIRRQRDHRCNRRSLKARC